MVQSLNTGGFDHNLRNDSWRKVDEEANKLHNDWSMNRRSDRCIGLQRTYERRRNQLDGTVANGRR